MVGHCLLLSQLTFCTCSFKAVEIMLFNSFTAMGSEKDKNIADQSTERYSFTAMASEKHKIKAGQLTEKILFKFFTVLDSEPDKKMADQSTEKILFNFFTAMGSEKDKKMADQSTEKVLFNPTLSGRFWYLHSLAGAESAPLDIFFVL